MITMYSSTSARPGIARPPSSASGPIPSAQRKSPRRAWALAGQADAGFVLAGFHEDAQARPRFLIDRYLPTFLASLAHKP